MHGAHPVVIGRGRLRALLGRNDVASRRTTTWKDSNDPLRDEQLDRIEEALDTFPDRVVAFDELGPLGLYPVEGRCWAGKTTPRRVRANSHELGSVRQLHGCSSVGDDQHVGTPRQKKGAEDTRAAVRQIRARRSDNKTISVILDNLSCHKRERIRTWCAGHAEGHELPPRGLLPG